MVNKLGLNIKKHLKPYDHQWLNDEGEMRVKHQVEVSIVIGKYEDEILCDCYLWKLGIYYLEGRGSQTEECFMMVSLIVIRSSSKEERLH
ncbi:hypothetical protein V5N11_003852 [Cardamine amara subsp. amara]|uniref:Uncharacterized protein n=1 Tax=Cardamine amara subsp. amara TaxID=228776 RepID=A0ABD1BNN6_CARAN